MDRLLEPDTQYIRALMMVKIIRKAARGIFRLVSRKLVMMLKPPKAVRVPEKNMPHTMSMPM